MAPQDSKLRERQVAFQACVEDQTRIFAPKWQRTGGDLLKHGAQKRTSPGLRPSLLRVSAPGDIQATVPTAVPELVRLSSVTPTMASTEPPAACRARSPYFTLQVRSRESWRALASELERAARRSWLQPEAHREVPLL